MDEEVSAALNFVLSYLYCKLPRRRVDCFGEQLQKCVKHKFSGHWYPDTPQKGSAFRCLKVSGAAPDPVIEQAAISSGLQFLEVLEYLPADLSIWVDPGEVSYRIGEKGQVRILYSERNQFLGAEMQSYGFNPEAQVFRPIIDGLSSSLNNLRVSPVHEVSPARSWGSPSPTNGGNSPVAKFNQRQQPQTFTAATFAATKFGSTKLKSHAKRPTRLSPTEFNGALPRQHHHQPQQHNAVLQNHWMYGVGAVSPASGLSPITNMPPTLGGPSQTFGLPSPGFTNGRGVARSLSPRDPRQDMMEYQRMLMAQQYQLQQLQQQQVQEKLQRAMCSSGGLPSPTYDTSDLSPEYNPARTSSFTSLAHLNSIYGSPAGPLAVNDDLGLSNGDRMCGSPLGGDSGFGPIGSGRQGKKNGGMFGAEGLNGRPSSPAGSSGDGQGSLIFGDNPTGGWSPYASLQHLLVAN